MSTVNWLNSARCPRPAAGKYLTAYPADEDEFRCLAQLLDRATAGLPGPEILSDLRYRPGSAVYYRFGGFRSRAVLDDDGCYRQVIAAPDGTLVEDRRDAWFAPPGWAPPVLTGPARVPAPGGVLVGGRFLVREALRYTGSGGIFHADDQRGGGPVAVKQARAHLGVDPDGRDCRDRLRQEALVLARLAPTGRVPRVVGVVEEPGHTFLVREFVTGTTLRSWVAATPSGGPAVEDGLALARALVELLAAVHGAGLVLVDVSPNNVLVGPGGALRLIDLEHAADAGQPVYPAGTPGYTAPEHAGNRVAAQPAADLFGLGGLLFLLATGADPVLAADDPGGRPDRDRLRGWLDEVRAGSPLAAKLAPAVLGLLAPRPGQRWSLRRVRRWLDRPANPAPARLAAVDVDRLLGDGLAWLLGGSTPEHARLWPTGDFGAAADPVAVQHGAAGVLGTLLAHPDRDAVQDAVARTTGWIERRLPAESPRLPGLYFGRSGTAWALHEAGTMLGDHGLAARALTLAAGIPLAGAGPDVAHGVAGAGLTALRLWQASGDGRFEHRVRACADHLVAAARLPGGALCWPIPTALRSTLAGQTHYGYAHGTAGVGAFLLAAAAATGEDRYAALAGRAADTLRRTALVVDGAAHWPVGPADATLAGPGWCTGSAGIGAFLLRAGLASGESALLDLARAAAVAVHRDRGRSTVAACHGLAGGGQFLLDAAGALGEPRYRRFAEDVARMLAARAVRRGGRLLVPDETGLGVVADYGVGLAGVLAFLIRLRHGGRTPWTVEPEDVRAIGARHQETPIMRKSA